MAVARRSPSMSEVGPVVVACHIAATALDYITLADSCPRYRTESEMAPASEGDAAGSFCKDA